MTSPIWKKLLATERVNRTTKSSPGGRRAFEIDNDAIIWSDPFRRLVDKTQVFPLPDNDHIHNRLTHSLEVASVGRTIGRNVGAKLVGAGTITADDATDIASIISAACLAHDIGNPPFGHSGEESIGEWAKAKTEDLSRSGVSTEILQEIGDFEGNAVGFRILVRHQQPTEGGLRLTAATLAAGAKYPCSWNEGLKKHPGIHRKKYGFLHTEAKIFAEVAEATGMVQDGPQAWKRHPLAWLVEAADDIANNLIDIEDGYRAGAIDYASTVDSLLPIAIRHNGFTSNQARYEASGKRGYIGALRSIALGVLNDDICAAFMSNTSAIEGGSHDQTLLESSPSFPHISDKIKPLLIQKCFNSDSVLRLEIAGNRVVHSLLDNLTDAAIFQPGSKSSKKLLSVLGIELSAPDDPSTTLLELVEHVSGMTDGFALRTFRLLNGVTLPGRQG